MDLKSNVVPLLELKVEKCTLAKAVRAGLQVGSTAVMLSLSPMALSQTSFSAVFELSDLDGSNGFVINGIDQLDRSGRSVSGAGDINGDGIDDVIIGANTAGPPGVNGLNNNRAGESYVLFGGAGVGSAGNFDLSDLDGSDGFVINGIDAYDYSGRPVSCAGDVNGDGVDDLIIGASNADQNGNSRAGEGYVIFGGGGVGGAGVVELSGLDGSDGYVIKGIDASDSAGVSVSGAADINGDGIDDLIIGAAPYTSEPYSYSNSSIGESYVLFGGSSVGSTGNIELADLDGIDGFVIHGVDAGDSAGSSVSVAGDFNGDGLDDLIVGASRADSNGGTQAGKSYVIFGGVGLGSTGNVELSDLDGNNGFVISGINAYDYSGSSVSHAGDINADGIDDLIIGANRADPYGNGYTGASYVLFGGSGVGGSGDIELANLDGSDGFAINGIDVADNVGYAISGGGDINGDGLSDLIIGAYRADPNGNSSAGESYVVFGGSSVGAGGKIQLLDLDGIDGFVLNGVDESDQSGISVSIAGDINADGVSDLIIGASLGEPNGTFGAGESYIVFGKYTVPFCNGLPVTVDLNLGQTTTPNADVVMGTSGADDIRGKAGNDTICGMGGNDFIHGNSGDDWIDGGDGVDNLRGGQGNDVVNTGSGATVGTTSRAFGGNGDDEINGGADADDLRGGRGADTIKGFGGDDVITGNEDNDIINGGTGFDTVKGGNGDDDLRGGADDDVVNGGSGDDVLNGGAGSSDLCDGGSGSGDTATSNCEMVINVP